MGDIFTPKKRSDVMRRIRSKNTEPEKLLFSLIKRFWPTFRYRKHRRGIPGTPDVFFPRQKIAVFVDGDFWHGKLKEGRFEKLPEYWQNKIRTNMERDERQFGELVARGIRPIRFFAGELKKNPEGCIAQIEECLVGNVRKDA
ncbi:MAG: mismatch endonuclease, patch repair protein [Patescibacteria group bacterium]|nr:mismatch endonuclease, patch repair protein [Patescibacteria group bacterium]